MRATAYAGLVGDARIANLVFFDYFTNTEDRLLHGVENIAEEMADLKPSLLAPVTVAQPIARLGGGGGSPGWVCMKKSLPKREFSFFLSDELSAAPPPPPSLVLFGESDPLVPVLYRYRCPKRAPNGFRNNCPKRAPNGSIGGQVKPRQCP